MGPWPALCAQAGAGYPGWGPDVRGFATGQMSGLGGRMSGLAWIFHMHSVMEGPDFQEKGPDVRWLARGRMSGPGDRMSGLAWLILELPG